ARVLEPIFDITIETHGFDVATGLPRARDHRDLPNLWREGFYVMDVQKLQKRLSESNLHIGIVAQMLPKFIQSRPAPVAFISFDLDYSTSTVQAFKLLEADQAILLPRIHCYFDDIMGKNFSEFNGERLAISEFNGKLATRKIAQIPGLRYYLRPPHRNALWPDMMFIAHIFDHPMYERYDGLVEVIRP